MVGIFGRQGRTCSGRKKTSDPQRDGSTGDEQDIGGAPLGGVRQQRIKRRKILRFRLRCLSRARDGAIQLGNNLGKVFVIACHYYKSMTPSLAHDPVTSWTCVRKNGESPRSSDFDLVHVHADWAVCRV